MTVRNCEKVIEFGRWVLIGFNNNWNQGESKRQQDGEESIPVDKDFEFSLEVVSEQELQGERHQHAAGCRLRGFTHPQLGIHPPPVLLAGPEDHGDQPNRKTLFKCSFSSEVANPNPPSNSLEHAMLKGGFLYLSLLRIWPRYWRFLFKNTRTVTLCFLLH